METEEEQALPQPTPSPDAKPSDRSLLRRLRGGNQDAATELYLRYAHRLRALVKARCSPDLARRVEPEDIVQSVFRRFFRRVRQGDYDVPAGEELWGLFLVIALNRIRAAEAYHRAGKRDVRLTIEAGGGENYFQSAVQGDETAYTVLQMTIEETLERLSRQQRRMVELRVQGHEVAEIARLVGRSKRTVERNLQEIRSRLRSCFDQESQEDAHAP